MGGTAAILLAAGLSKRMGSLKALLPWKDSSLIEYQVRMLLNVPVQQLIVILGHKASEIQTSIDNFPAAKFVFNPRYKEKIRFLHIAGLSLHALQCSKASVMPIP